MVTVPCLLFVQSWLMACVVHLGVAVIIVLRALLGDAEDAADTIFQHSGTLIGAEFIMAACVGILVRFVYNSFEQRVAARLRENHVSSQLDAASGLLQLTCEAVMELDDDFRFFKSSTNFQVGRAAISLACVTSQICNRWLETRQLMRFMTRMTESSLNSTTVSAVCVGIPNLHLRIVEQAVALRSRNIFLDLDVQAMQATQSPDLPDNVVSFERMPLFCAERPAPPARFARSAASARGAQQFQWRSGAPERRAEGGKLPDDPTQISAYIPVDQIHVNSLSGKKN
ncbi:unnamed protein product [Effrenium voratum]|nr:unnamed protein product [Effrenium voratum]